MIEKNIFFFWTGPEITNSLRKNIAWVKAIHPNHSVRVINELQAAEIIKSILPDLGEIYLKIKIPAALSDIARLAIVYKYGGWYLDCDMSPRYSLEHFEKLNKLLYLFWRIDNNKITVPNAIVGGKREHPFFKDALRIIERLILGRVNNYSVFKTTGPIALVPAASVYTNENYTFYENFDYTWFDVVNDGKTKGSWTYQENCGIFNDAEHPCMFNGNTSVERVGSKAAFEYYCKIFAEYPTTQKRNFQVYLRLVAVHLIKNYPELKPNIIELGKQYLDSVKDAQLLMVLK